MHRLLTLCFLGLMACANQTGSKLWADVGWFPQEVRIVRSTETVNPYMLLGTDSTKWPSCTQDLLKQFRRGYDAYHSSQDAPVRLFYGTFSQQAFEVCAEQVFAEWEVSALGNYTIIKDRSQTILVGWKKIGDISVAILHAERERIKTFLSPANSLSKSQGLGKLLFAKPPQSAEWITGTEDVFEPILGVPSLGFYAESTSKDTKLSLELLFSSTASAELALSSVDEVWQRIPEETRATAIKTQKLVKTRLLIELQSNSRTALGDLFDILAAI